MPAGQRLAALPSAPAPGALADRVVADGDVARRTRTVTFANLLGWLVVVLFSDYPARQPVLVYAVGVLLLAVMTTRIVLAGTGDRIAGSQTRRWRTAFYGATLVNALVWGVFASLAVYAHGLDETAMLLLLATAGIAAGAAMTLSPVPRVGAAYLFLMLGPVIAAAAGRGTTHAYGIAALGGLYLAFLLAFVRRLSREYWDRIAVQRLLDERARELEAARDGALAAARAKDGFLATMSHELRTPLTAVLGTTAALKERVYGPLTARQEKCLDTVHESGRHLLAIIDDILDLAKFETGKLELAARQVDVRELCESSVRLLAQSAKAKELDVVLRIDPRLDGLHGDERLLRQMLLNLLGNAVKFTPQGGRIGVDAEVVPEQNLARLVVWDTGAGIAAEELSRLFQPFERLDTRLSPRGAGQGLGLALAERVAKRHGGSIRAHSQPGTGSRFVVTLPLGSEGAAEPETGAGPAARNPPAA